MTCLRERSGYQNRWIFGKIPNSLWPRPPHFWKIVLQFFSKNVRKKPYIKVKNLQHKFLDWKWPLPPSLEVFRKFICFGSLTRPLATSRQGRGWECNKLRIDLSNFSGFVQEFLMIHSSIIAKCKKSHHALISSTFWHECPTNKFCPACAGTLIPRRILLLLVNYDVRSDLKVSNWSSIKIFILVNLCHSDTTI